MTGPAVLDGHEFACDRRPYDDPIWILTWRWRWHCSCGATGGWQVVDPDQAYRGWRKHCKNLRERGRSAHAASTT